MELSTEQTLDHIYHTYVEVLEVVQSAERGTWKPVQCIECEAEALEAGVSFRGVEATEATEGRVAHVRDASTAQVERPQDGEAEERIVPEADNRVLAHVEAGKVPCNRSQNRGGQR